KNCWRSISTVPSRCGTETNSVLGKRDNPNSCQRSGSKASSSRHLYRISPLRNRNPVANGCILDFRQHHPRNQLQFASVGPILDNAINRALLQSEIQQFCSL